MATAAMAGARLAYVVVPLEGAVQRLQSVWDKKTRKIVHRPIEEPAGFMVFFPRGHALRLKSKKALRQHRLDRPAKIVNLDGLNDPSSPLGRLMLEQDDQGRASAFERLEAKVIALATRQSGKHLLTRDGSQQPEGNLDDVLYAPQDMESLQSELEGASA